MSHISSVSGDMPPAPAAKTQVDFNSAACQPVTSGGQGVGDAIADSASAVGIQNSSAEAVDTVYHLHAPFKSVGIEFNPDMQTADVAPASQRALRGWT